MSALDLSAFASAAAGDGAERRARRRRRAASTRPAIVSLALANARAGRWNEGLLPVRRLRAELRARPDDPASSTCRTLAAELGSTRLRRRQHRRPRPLGAGRTGTSTPSCARSSRRRSTRARRQRRGRAARPPTTARAADAGFGAGRQRRRSGAASTLDAPTSPASSPIAACRARRRRRRAFASRRARARNEIELRSGEASLGDAARDARRPPRAQRRERAVARDRPARAGRFDPAPWWPGGADSLLARGANRLNAKGDFDLRPARRRTPRERVRRCSRRRRGTATLDVVDSLLAGIALAGRRRATSTATAAPDRRSTSSPPATTCASKARLAARGASNDDWRVVVDAPRLDALAPLLARAGPRRRDRAATALAGSAVARRRTSPAAGPHVSSDGELHGTALRFGSARGARAPGPLAASAAATTRRSTATLALDGVDVGGPGARSHRRPTSARHRARAPRRAARRLGAAAAGVDRRARGTAARAPRRRASAAARDRVGSAASATTAPASRRRRPRAASCRRRRRRPRRRRRRAAPAGWRGTLREAVARSLATPAAHLARRARRARQRRLGRRAAARQPRAGQRRGARRHAALEPRRLAGRRRARRRRHGSMRRRRRRRSPSRRSCSALQPGFGWGGDLRVGAHLKARSAAERQRRHGGRARAAAT